MEKKHKKLLFSNKEWAKIIEVKKSKKSVTEVNTLMMHEYNDNLFKNISVFFSMKIYRYCKMLT